MDYDSFKAVVMDGGGFDHIAMLVFDNSITPNDRVRESDFVKFGSEYFYKEPVLVRDKKNHEYTEKGFAYHPLSCLQNVILMENPSNIASIDLNDIMNGHD